MTARRSLRGAVVVIAALAVLAGCEEPPVETAERVRAIKPYYVSEPSGGDVRRYSGEVIAAATSALSFAVSGTVATVEVSQGDRVTQGQTLATLDAESFSLNMDAARSELAAAQAEYDIKASELDRQRQLYDKGWVAKAAYDRAVTAFDAAEGQLNLARSRLGLAERDREKAMLTAPFDGVIALRDVEPFVEIRAGQTVFRIDTDDALEISLSVPDSIVGRIAMGAPVVVQAIAVPGCGCSGRITEIGATASTANAVEVKAAILDGGDGLLPGMAIEASVTLSDDGGRRGYLAPLVAIAPGDEAALGYVFKFDPESETVRRTAIKSDGSISGNLVGVSEGIVAGDIIAAAGVSFLRDGQRVRLMTE